MKLCIFGAGAMGGWIGGLLARQGVDVTLVARGPHLAAMRERGLTIRMNGEEFVTHPRLAESAEAAGPQDYVFISLKAHSVPPVAELMRPLLGPNTAVVTASNGIPWWYFYKLAGPWENHRLETVDPGNKQWDVFGPERAVGCILWPACEVVEPGVIQHEYGDRISVGEPDGSKSERVQALSQALASAGLKAPIRPNLRNEIWVKLWGNLSLNPVSALTLSTLEDLTRDPHTHAVIRQMMVEAQAVGEKLGVRFAMTVDKRIEAAQEVGAHRTSMLQDLEKGRPMEIDALVGVVSELGRLVEVPTPTIDTVYHLVVRRAREAGSYPG
ncbi:MAG: 2-dehydropantoate 2-reductase [Chloroflexi bacterium]|nr:2-dehydropantoate 2-reductase [Chloroflexota bacterium]